MLKRTGYLRTSKTLTLTRSTPVLLDQSEALAQIPGFAYLSLEHCLFNIVKRGSLDEDIIQRQTLPLTHDLESFQ
jgi:hypothetical protein